MSALYDKMMAAPHIVEIAKEAADCAVVRAEGGAVAVSSADGLLIFAGPAFERLRSAVWAVQDARDRAEYGPQEGATDGG